MNKANNNIAVVLAAGGRGERCTTSEAKLPKQFIKLADVPMYIWSLRTFCNHPAINQIVLVGADDKHKDFKEGIEEYLPQFSNKILFASGGLNRQASVFSGLEMFSKQKLPPEYVLVHDAARPFITIEDLDRIIAMLEKGAACALAIPVSDTIKRIEDELIIETVKRENLYLMQTPQAADFKTLLQAYRSLQAKDVATTDDAGVLEHFQVPVRLCPGSSLNFKITNADDFLLAQTLAPLFKAEIDLLKLRK